jgi:hypothetical protein
VLENARRSWEGADVLFGEGSGGSDEDKEKGERERRREVTS